MRKLRGLASLLAICLVLLSTTVVAADTIYTVKPNDSLAAIARRFGTTIQALVIANDITNPNIIQVGQVLVVPVDDSAANESNTSPAAAATPAPQTAVAPPQRAAQQTTASGEITYTVQPGDSLAKIADRFNVSMFIIAEANYIEDLNIVRLGQELVIPGASGADPQAAGSQTQATAETAVAAAAPAAPPPPAAPPVFGGGFELGGQTQSFANRQLMRDVGMTWVKFQHKWSPGDSPDVVAGRIQDAHNSGFKVLLSIPGAQTYPPPGGIDFGSYVEFLRGVAAYGPDAIEVWNEMNIDFEWPAGEIDPASYVNNMLAPAYNAIKSVNTNILVISGAPAPTGFDNGINAWADNRYLAGMASAGAANYMDCVGVHHNAGATAPGASSGHPAGSHYSWYFRPTLDLYYNSFGGARKVCFTELGYLSGDGFASISPNFSWAGNTSVSQHAQWLDQAVDQAQSSGRVRLLIIFNVDFTYYDVNGDPQAGYAMLRPDGSCPACDALRQ